MATDTDFVATLERRIKELNAEVAELRGVYARSISNGIVVRGAAYQQALEDTDYKECPTCKEPCLPMCPICDASSWEKTAQTYYDEMHEAEEWRRGAEGALVTSLPPRTGAHTEEAFTEHKKRYEESVSVNGAYAAGTDAVAAVILKLKGTL